MSDNLQTVSGAGATFKIGDKDYRLKPPSFGTFGEVERHIASLKPNPLDALSKTIQNFPEDKQAELMRIACEVATKQTQSVPEHEVREFLSSYSGICFFWWVAIRDNHSEVENLEQASKILADLDNAQLLKLQMTLMKISGLEDLGNSPSPQETQKMDLLESRGLKSITG